MYVTQCIAFELLLFFGFVSSFGFSRKVLLTYLISFTFFHGQIIFCCTSAIHMWAQDLAELPNSQVNLCTSVNFWRHVCTHISSILLTYLLTLQAILRSCLTESHGSKSVPTWADGRL